MPSIEQTEVPSKIEMVSWIERRLTALSRCSGCGGMEQKGTRTHGHGQQCGDWGMVGYKDDGWRWKRVKGG